MKGCTFGVLRQRRKLQSISARERGGGGASFRLLRLCELINTYMEMGYFTIERHVAQQGAVRN